MPALWPKGPRQWVWFVVAGAELRLSLASCAPRLFSRDSAVLIKGVPSLAHQPAHSPQRKEHCRTREVCLDSPGCRHILNALTCYGLRFVERTPPESHRQNHHMVYGSPGWIRTSDQPLRRRLFFPLSYRQKKAPHDGEALNSLSTYEAMATISDLHEIYAFQFGFARLTSKFVAFCCERDRVTEISAPLSSRLKLLRIASQ